MEFTKLSPIIYNVSVVSGSSISCEFKVKGTKRSIKLNIELHIYFKHHLRPNMRDVVSSELQSVITSKIDTTHNINIIVPEFKDAVQSFIIIQIDKSADIYEKVFLEYINVDVGLQPQKIERMQLDQIRPEQSPVRPEQSPVRQVFLATISFTYKARTIKKKYLSF